MGDIPLIYLRDVVKTYTLAKNTSTVLNCISLSIHKGEMLALVGASGSGKSTLMNVIGLLDKADSGIYQLESRDVLGLSHDEAALVRNQKISFVFQQFHLLSRFSALQNVILPLTYRNLSRDVMMEAGLSVLNRVGMGAFVHYKPTQLSGGQQQRVAIARALITEPEIMLADEPTGALDTRTGKDIMDLFLSLHAEGRTVLVVTHDLNVAARCARKITLADGHIVSESHA